MKQKKWLTTKSNQLQILKHNMIFLLPAIFSFLGISCRQNTLYHTYIPISTTDGWHKQDTLSFEIPPSFKKGEYRMEIGLRNTNQYPFRDIWLSISQNWEDSLEVVTDTLHFYLADEQGKWINGGNSGDLFQHTYFCEKKFAINPSSKSILKMTHLMKKEPLPGIHDAGIRLVKP